MSKWRTILLAAALTSLLVAKSTGFVSSTSNPILQHPSTLLSKQHHPYKKIAPFQHPFVVTPPTVTLSTLTKLHEKSSDKSGDNGDASSSKLASVRRYVGRIWQKVKRILPFRNGKEPSINAKSTIHDTIAIDSVAQDNPPAVEDTTAIETIAQDNPSSVEETRVPTGTARPEGPRWAISANTTDLSGLWKPIITNEFKLQYDEYLQNCSEPFIFRNVVLSALGLMREEFNQTDGRELTITGKNPVGTWTRILVASGADLQTTDYEPFNVTIVDPDKESVQVEAWWEDEGTVHKSILRGKKRVLGGEFVTLRYLDKNVSDAGEELICESFFCPSPASHGFRPGYVKWRFQRVH